MATFLACLYRRETRQTCFLAVLALFCELSRKNGWTLAEQAGLDGPQRIQRLWPRSWMNDPERCRKVHLPEDVRMQTKPAMAADMLDEIRSEGISAEWVAGDEVYGGNPTFRKRLIEAGQKFVLTIKSTERMWTRQPEMTVRRLRSGRIERKPYALGPQLRSAKETVAAFAPSP